MASGCLFKHTTAAPRTCIVVHAGLALPAALLEIDGPGGRRGAGAAHAVRLQAVAVVLDVQAGLGILRGRQTGRRVGKGGGQRGQKVNEGGGLKL